MLLPAKHHRGVGTEPQTSGGHLAVFSPGRSLRRRAAEKGSKRRSAPGDSTSAGPSCIHGVIAYHFM